MGFHRVAAIGDPCGHHAELQRRGQHETLPDGIDERLAGMPVLTERGLFPGAVRHDTRLLAGEVESGDIAETEFLRANRNRIDADRARELVEEHVAGMLERARHIDMAMAFLLP